MRRKNADYLVPDRRWTATIKYKGDAAGYRTITTTIYGKHATDAETRYAAEHQDVAAVIIHAEQWIR